MSNYKNQNQGGKNNALADYVEVNERIVAFYKKYPDGSIQTEIISIDEDRVVIKAYAYRDREDPRPSTGHAEEIRSSSYINKTSALENGETSAVGRALALLGFHVKKSIASREEVANAIAQQEEIKTAEKVSPRQIEPKITKDQAGQIKLLAEQLVGLGISKKDSFNLMRLEVGEFKILDELTEERASRAIGKLEDLKAQNQPK